jgi:hypothetical protein
MPSPGIFPTCRSASKGAAKARTYNSGDIVVKYFNGVLDSDGTAYRSRLALRLAGTTSYCTFSVRTTRKLLPVPNQESLR